MYITTAHKFFVFIVAVLLIFSCWYKFSIPILAQQVTRTIPAPGFTTITSTSPPINTASYPAPAINPGEKVIGVFAFIHDGGTSWSFTPTVRFKDGSEGNLIVGSKTNSDQGKYVRGLYDVCNGNTDPPTKHYSV